MLNFKQYVEMQEGKKEKLPDAVQIAKRLAHKTSVKELQSGITRRSSSWGGRPTPKQDRQSSRRKLRDF